MEEEMQARGLIRAKIRTRKGNVVWRWVKPDNGNIIDAPLPMVEAVMPEPEPTPEPNKFTVQGYVSCCGATIMAVQPTKKGKQVTDLEILQDYPGSGYYAQYEAYIKERDRYELDSYNWKAYNNALSQYNEAAFIAYERKKLNRNQVTYDDYVSPGICVADAEFPNSKQSPGGWWFRSDRDPVNKATDDNFDPADVVDFEALKKDYNRKGGFSGKMAMYNNYTKSKNMWVGYGLSTYNGNQKGIWLHAWLGIWNSKIKPGDCVSFIMNQAQRNACEDNEIPRKLAAAGFREILRTGNKNHPGTSTLYLYERVITEADLSAKALFDGY